MKKKRTTNPHCLPAGKLRNQKLKKLPPLNLFIRERLKLLGTSHEEIATLLNLSRSKSYVVLCGHFPTDYEPRLALAKLLRTPLEKLLLWEYGLLDAKDQPKPEEGVEELRS
jgi:hypothetical protein